MKIEGIDKNKKHIYRAFSTVSAAHTYGNVATIMAHYIKSLFPEGYFKEVYISSRIAYKEFDYRKSTRKEIHKKRKPALIIRPRIILRDDERFLDGTIATTRVYDDFKSGELSDLAPFFEDKEKNIYVKYLRNRMSMEFDVIITTKTFMETINTVNYIKNRVRWELPITLDTSLESNVSKNIFRLISKDSGIPMFDEQGSIKRFLDYCNSRSYFPITYKLKTSSGNDEFFRFYDALIDTMFRDLNCSEESSMKDMVDDQSQITFNVRAEFWGVGVYYYFTQNTDLLLYNDLSSITNEKNLVPLYTMKNPVPDIKLPEGFILSMNSLYSVEPDTKDDILDLSVIINSSIMSILEYCDKNSIDKEAYIHFEVTKDSKRLIEGTDFYIDMSKYELHTYNCNESSTYRVFVYFNQLYGNELLKNLIDAEYKPPMNSMDATWHDNKSDIMHVDDHKEDMGVPNYGNGAPNEKDNGEDNIVYIGTTIKKKIMLSDIEEMEKIKVKRNETIIHDFNLNNEKIVIAIPYYWNKMISAYDSEKDNIITSSENFIMNMKEKDYKVYIFGKDTIKNYRVEFKFK